MANRTLKPLSSTEKTPGFGTGLRYFDFTADLDDDDTLASPQVTTTSTTLLTISSVAVNTAVITEDDVTIAVGKGIGFRGTSIVEGTDDVVIVECSYESANGERDTVSGELPIRPTT